MTTTRKGLRAQELVLCGIFSALIAVGAFLRVPVPLVPFTLQLFFVTMAGFVLGPRLGAVSALVYVALGLLGVPIFTEGGGLGYVFKPTFGYLISFALAAYVTGKIAHAAKEPSYARLALAAAAGLAVSYAIRCGLSLLHHELCPRRDEQPLERVHGWLPLGAAGKCGAGGDRRHRREKNLAASAGSG